MSSQKTSNNDSCRDLSGRRLSTLKEAKKMAEYLESEPLRKKAAADAQKAKLEALERQLGIVPGRPTGPDIQDSSLVAGRKRRFDDTEYLEQSKEIVDGVKSAVAAGLLRKRKKGKVLDEESERPSAAPATAQAQLVENISETLAEATNAVVNAAESAPAVAAIGLIAGVAAST